MKCRNCHDSLWVCEEHENMPFEECFGGAGMPCECNENQKLPDDFMVLIDLEGDKRH